MKLKNTIFSLLLVSVLGFCPIIASAEYQPTPKITFTFDDVSKTLLEFGLPIFAEYNLPAVLYAETLHLDSNQPWAMSWNDVKNLRDQYGWEIGNHTINHPDLTSVDDATLINEIAGAKDSFINQGINPETFATPQGRYDYRVLKAISKYHTAHRAAWGGPNIFPDFYNNYDIKALEIKHTTTVQEAKQWIDDAVLNNQWLMILMHDVTDGVPLEYQYNKDDLREVIEYAVSKQIKFTTTTQAINLTEGPNVVLNNSFETLGVNGFAQNWTRSNNQNVVIDQNNNGNYPSPKNSLKITSGQEQREAITGFISVFNKDYLLEMLQDASNFTNGGWAVWVNEYDTNNNWLGGQWLGGNYAPFFGTRKYLYAPTSGSVSKIKIHIYTEASSVVTLYVDSVKLAELKNSEIPPPPPPPPEDNLLSNGNFESVSGGFATGWTNNNPSNVVIDQNNKGINPSIKNSLKITGSSTQNTAFSPLVNIDDPNANYEISYFLRTENWLSGGTAIWVNEYDTNSNWLGGQWLGGIYTLTEGIFKYNLNPSDLTKFIDVHLFTEEGSLMDLYIDEAKVIKK